jgi:ribosomal protein L9
MKAAAQMAQANASKEELAAELEKVSDEYKALEKQIKWLKAKIDPMLTIGERIGKVEKIEVHGLMVDDDLLKTLEEEHGPEIVRRELNTKLLRELMEKDKALDQSIPRAPGKTQIRVGEKF